MDFTALLKRRGLRATPKRLSLLELLHGANTPLPAEDIAQRASAFADTATVYRALESFEKGGLVRRVDFRHTHAHYELALDHHHHLICTSCEASEEIAFCPAPKLSRSARGIRSRRFARILDHSFELYGLCKKCG